MTTKTLVYLALLACIVFWAIGGYNRLIRLKNTISNSFGQIDVQLKRRYDLIPNLVEAARKYLEHERETLESVILARNTALAASEAARARPGKAQAVNALGAAEEVLASSLGRLFVVAEAYPELKADQRIKDLSEEIVSTENKVAFARQAFNDAVLDYNNAQAQFPTLVLARVFGFAPSAMLQATQSDEERQTVRIKF
ncbi:MAG: LemA family protein [Pseudomonadota bacterium]